MARKASRAAVEPASDGGAKTLLREQAYRELKRLIQSGAIAGGAFLSERQLVERLGMSKTPIRSALLQLEAEGLVTVSPQQGILVRELSAREITELFDLRDAVEPFVVRRLAERLPGAAQGRLQANLRTQEAAARANDPVATTDLDMAFHLLLAELLDNREICRWLDCALAKLYRDVVRISRDAEGRLQSSFREHAGIAEAVLAAQPALAAQRMEAHLHFGRRFLLSR